MTRERAKELLPVIEAFVAGEQVQLSTNDGKAWMDVSEGGECMFDGYGTQWRIKPKPLEVWVVVGGEGTPFEAYSTASEEALRSAQWYAKERGKGARVVKMREVVE